MPKVNPTLKRLGTTQQVATGLIRDQSVVSGPDGAVLIGHNAAVIPQGIIGTVLGAGASIGQVPPATPPNPMRLAVFATVRTTVLTTLIQPGFGSYQSNVKLRWVSYEYDSAGAADSDFTGYTFGGDQVVIDDRRTGILQFDFPTPRKNTFSLSSTFDVTSGKVCRVWIYALQFLAMGGGWQAQQSIVASTSTFDYEFFVSPIN
jgi:hypothetical protein